VSSSTETPHDLKAINFSKKFGLFHEQWQPKVVAEMNDYQFKVVRLQGDSKPITRVRDT
jgi:hypothetical protein